MPVSIGRLAVLALGRFGPFQRTALAEGYAISSSADELSHALLDGFSPQPALRGRPHQVGFRRPQQAEHQKRDCLTNGTNFCFGDSSNYCSSCGVCCSASDDSSTKWCCPSGGVCCGSSCCGSGQTCSNGQCYLPVKTVTATSSVFITSTSVVTNIATVLHKVLESSVINSVVEVTDTSAQTQTNWIYVSAITVGKRAEPSTDAGGDNDQGPDGITEALSASSATPVLASTKTPAVSTDAKSPEFIQPRGVEAVANTLAASQSTTTINIATTATTIVTSTLRSTMTVETTLVDIETLFQTNTVALDAKTTVEATSTRTYTSHRPVTLTVTEVATVHPSAGTKTASSPPSTATAALITSVPNSKTHKSTLSTSATAEIAVGATVFGAALLLFIFYVCRRYRARKKTLQTITEDYAYLGTGRSHGFDGAVARSNSGSGVNPPQIYSNVYSGPPPPSSFRKPSMSQTDPSERGLPPIPWYTVTKTTSPPATSPVSPTAPAFPLGSKLGQEASPNSPPYSRAVHVRSGSAQTANTAASSTIVGGNSQRTSLRSNSGKAARLSNGETPHKRVSSSGAGSGMTSEVANDFEGESPPAFSEAGIPPSSLPAPQAYRYTTPDPPSPALRPQLGPLRIVNLPADAAEPTDDDEPDPAIPPRARHTLQ